MANITWKQLALDAVAAYKEAIGSAAAVKLGDFANKIKSLVADKTSDATATASDILTGKTAYVNGEKIEGLLKEEMEGMCVWTVYDQYIPAGTLKVKFKYISGTAPTSTANSTAILGLEAVNIPDGHSLSEFNMVNMTDKTILSVTPPDITTNVPYTFKYTHYPPALTMYDSAGERVSNASKYDSNVVYYSSSKQIKLTTQYNFDLGDLTHLQNANFKTLSISLSEKIGNIIGYVVSNDISAYPQAGTQDGKGYKLLGQVSSTNITELSEENN